jgi:hypothetical protein
LKIARQDYRRLGWPAAIAAALLLAGAALVMLAEQSLANARASRDSARAARQQAQTRVEQVAEEEREIRQNLIRYQQMADRGMVGQENRLDLIEAIARIKTERRLFEIKYSIEPQKPLDYPGVVSAGRLDLAASRIKLDMLLLHEEDLLSFLADLERAGKAHVSVRDCSVLRIDAAATAQATRPRLRAECLIDLIVLREVQS